MSSGAMIDNIIMNIFTQSTKNTTEAHQEHLFSRSKDDAIQLYKVSMKDFTWRKYLYGITLIEITQADLEKMFNEFINDKIDFNTAHIIKSDIQQITRIPEKAQFISSMTPIGFKNDQDESRCYVNSTFQVLFSIYFLEH